MPIIGYPQAWSGSTDGKVTGDAIMVAQYRHHGRNGQTARNFEGQDRSDWHRSPGSGVSRYAALAARYTDAELAALVPDILPAGGAAAGRGGRGGRGGNGPALSQEEQRAVRRG